MAQAGFFINLFLYLCMVPPFKFLFTSIYNSLTNFFRGIDKVTDVVIAGMMSTCLNGICNVIFLLKFKWGITGYLIANLTGVLIPSLFLFIRFFFVRVY